MNVNKDVRDTYNKEWQWQEGDLTVTRSNQWTGPGCHDGCGVLYYTKDDKLVKVEGDPNFGFNQGKLCMRCLNLVEAVNHPDRLKWPLKRIGERGENKWKRISWDEAYDEIVEKVNHIKKEFGPECIIGMEGTGRNICWQVPLLTFAGFGSPNFAMGFLSGDSCMVPRTSISFCVLGDLMVTDCSQFHEDRYDNPEYKRPDVFLIWGNNPIISNPDGFFGHWIVECMQLGSKLIVIDPQLTWLASRAEVWLQVRPGTDTALAMAMIDVIIEEKLYDKQFVEDYCYGFDELAERCKTMPPAKAAEICWVSKELIIEAARYFAQAKPGALQWGLASDMSVNGIPQAHALMALNTICGNLEVPGGNLVAREPWHMNLAYQCGYFDYLSEEMRAKRIGDDVSPMHQFGFSSTASGDEILKAIESGKPYPIKMLWFQTTNPIANMAAEAPRVYDAIKSVEFNVVVDLFMTPTAVAFADLVLPAAMSCERNGLRTWWVPLRTQTKLTSYYEAKSDETIVLELCQRLNPNFPKHASDIQLLEERLIEGGVPYTNFQELVEKVAVWVPHVYRRHEKGLLRPDGEPGFNTPTGKVELYCTTLEGFGNDPLPYFEEPPESPVSTPELFKHYPYVLTTGHRSYEFFHSEHRQQKTMREFHPNPLVDMHPDTAAKHGISDGDWVWIENMRGRCKMVAKLTITMDPRTINAEHGWWFPEQEAAEPSLFGVFNSNINNLTTQCVTGPTGYGAPYKNLICRIYKATEENSNVTPGEQVTELGGFKYVRK